MSIRTFTVFQDQDSSSAAITTASKRTHTRDTPLVATKENLNPLTGLVFDAKPPLKKRKPSSSSALKVKPLPSSSRPSSKQRKFSSMNTGKDKGKRKAVLGVSGSRNSADHMDVLDGSEAEQLRTALGNRNAYNLTVMPLADVTQAYDESKMESSMMQLGKCAVEDEEHTSMGMLLHALSEENNVEIRDITSKETSPVQATQA